MSAISLSEQAALESAAAACDIDLIERWTGINSGSRNLSGLATMAVEIADAFSALPGTIALIDADPVETVDVHGSLVTLSHGQHIRMTVRPQAPIQLLLTGHMDTVFDLAHPFQSALWPEPGVLNAPGAADMKGGIALMRAALGAVERSPLRDRIGYEVVINSDEEVGSPSSAGLLREAARGKRAALTYEPALPDGTLAGARAGSGNFSIVFTGKAAHAGRNPQDGRNALLAAADLALRLSRASGIRDGHGFTCNPARIDGGGPNNIVPDHAVLRVNFRPRTPEDQAEARVLIDNSVAAVAREHDVAVHVHGGFGRPPKPMDEGARQLFDLVRRCGADLGLDIAWRDTGGVCDGNNIAACGVPVVDTMGARGGAIHSAEEYLIVDSLAERAQLSALTILRIAEGGLAALPRSGIAA